MQRQKTRIDPYTIGYIIDYADGFPHDWNYIIDRWYNIIETWYYIIHNWPTIIYESIQHYLTFEFGMAINFSFFDESYNDKDLDLDCDRYKGWDWYCDCDKDWDCDKHWDYDKFQKDETENDNNNERDNVQKDSSVFGTENDSNNERDKVQKDNSILETENDNNNVDSLANRHPQELAYPRPEQYYKNRSWNMGIRSLWTNGKGTICKSVSYSIARVDTHRRLVSIVYG